MFGQMMSPDLPNQLYAEPVRVGEQERLARRRITQHHFPKRAETAVSARAFTRKDPS
jgi:hypothetical protein